AGGGLDGDGDDATLVDAPAVVWEGEEGNGRTLTYRELRSLTDKLAHGLADRGVTEGDLVGIFLPMIPEAIAAMLAGVKLGAGFGPIFSGYASDAVATRLSDAGASALITADGFLRRGHLVKMKETADEAVAQVPSVETVVVVSRLGRTDTPLLPGRDVMLDELVAGRPDRFDARIVDSEHPLFLAYTSGTTGRPKGSVHVHGGWLVKVAEEAAFQT